MIMQKHFAAAALPREVIGEIYVPDEVRLLKTDDVAVFVKAHGVSSAGNFHARLERDRHAQRRFHAAHRRHAGHDLDRAVLAGDLDAEAAIFAVHLVLQVAEILGIEIAGVRVQRGQHAVHRRLDQLLLVDGRDVLVFGHVQHVALRSGCESNPAGTGRDRLAGPPYGPGRAPRPPHPAWGGRDEAMNKRLKLTEAQKKAIEAIRAKHAESLKAKFDGAASAKKALHEALEKTDSTTDQLRSLHKTAADAQFEVLLAHRAMRQEIRAQLTPEQREQAARLEGFRMGRMDRRGHGAGPGDPDLLTIKAFKLLQQADIIFYDDLTNSAEFLDSFTAEKVYVGKRKLKHSVIQAGINTLLFEAASSGKTVVRLKGGDPMIFAHGGEEIDYLQQRNIDVEVVPGISSALAAAAAAEVPLTHRSISSSVTFATGHPEKNFYIPASGTMVIYMGASNLKSLVRKVIEQGWSEQTPIMLIQNVSLPNQKKQLSTLKNVFESIIDYPSPLLVIIGEVMNR